MSSAVHAGFAPGGDHWRTQRAVMNRTAGATRARTQAATTSFVRLIVTPVQQSRAAFANPWRRTVGDGGVQAGSGGGGSFIDTELDVRGSKMTLDLGTGPGALLGAGYEFSVTRRVKVTPAFNFWYGWPSDVKVLGQTGVTGWKQGVWDVTIGVTLY